MNAGLKKLCFWAIATLTCLTVITHCSLSHSFAQHGLTSLGPPPSVSGDRAIEPIPESPVLNSDKVALGKQLFAEPKLSHDNSISCLSCHNLSQGGMDGRQVAKGINGALGNVNVPTVFNSALHFKQFWDGRADTLEEQIDDPVQDPREMGSTWNEVVRKLKADPQYLKQFKNIYQEGVTSDNIKNAIATFELSLNTPNSRFDRFLNGDESALSFEEKEGYKRFQSYGCVSCHQGILLGGNLFQKIGIFGNYMTDRGNITEADYGRFNVTKNEEDKFTFKVPSLRNVELTSPYFHDGSAQTLEKAVIVMMKYQLGREASQEDIDLIIKFLTTLTAQPQGVSP